MLFTIMTLADTGVALNDEAVVGERAEIVKALEIGSDLRTNASRKISITGLEHCPFGGTGDGVDDLQAETAHWQLRELAVCLTTPAHRDGAHQPGTTSRPGRNCVEAGAAELQSIVLVNRNRW